MKIVPVVSVYVIKDGKLLMVQENQPHCRGKWNLPAGHLDQNENMFDAAIREAKEETGLDVKLTGFLGVQNCAHGGDENPSNPAHLILIVANCVHKAKYKGF